MLEFIQCPHCQKKYTVHDQLRAATGKRIRCKHCSKAFEIHIQQQSPTPSEAVQADPTATMESNVSTAAIVEHDEPTESTPSKQELEKSVEKKATSTSKAPKQKRNVQLLITILLLSILIAGAIGAYVFFNHGSLFSDSSEKDKQGIIPHDIIKPLEIKLPPPPTEQVNEKSDSETLQPSPYRIAQAASKPVSATLSNSRSKAIATAASSATNKPSQVCKDISADYWVRSRTLATANMDTATYMKLLNQNLEQADEIRKLCKEKSLISKIAQAARSEEKPAWIEQEINLRTSTKAQ